MLAGGIPLNTEWLVWCDMYCKEYYLTGCTLDDFNIFVIEVVQLNLYTKTNCIVSIVFVSGFCTTQIWLIFVVLEHNNDCATTERAECGGGVCRLV